MEFTIKVPNYKIFFQLQVQGSRPDPATAAQKQDLLREAELYQRLYQERYFLNKF
jgi:hypothetical protein